MSSKNTIDQRKWTIRYYSSTGNKYMLIMYRIIISNIDDSFSLPVALCEDQNGILTSWHHDGNRNTFSDIYEFGNFYCSNIGDFESCDEEKQ